MKTILQYPDPILHEISKPVKTIDGYIRELVADMTPHLTRNSSGLITVGLAAVQLGETVRLIGVRFGSDLRFIVNPVIVKVSDKQARFPESCLSIEHGHQEYLVTRHKLVKVKGIDLNENEVTYKGRDLFGRVLQHEIDHLDGRLIIDVQPNIQILGLFRTRGSKVNN